MKKLFLIPLLACFSCVMAWGATVEVGTFEQLKVAIDGASNGDVIKLTADIDYGTAGGTNYLNIKNSITLDGQGHTLTGACKRANADFWATLYVNEKAEDVAMMDIVIKDITLVNNKITSAYGASIRFQHNINTVTLTNVVMDITGGVRGNSAPMFLGGSDTNNPTYTLNNCKLLGKNNDYPYYSWIKAHIIAKDTYFSGYCGMYFKEGSYGTIVNATACQFDAPNVHSGQSNAFAVFAFEDAGITMNLTNCGMNAEQIGDQSQRLLDIRYSIPLANRTADIVDLTIDGDNSYFNAAWSEQYNNPVLNQIIFTPAGQPYTEESIPHVKMTIKGGTYSFDPTTIGWYDSWILDEGNNVTGEVNIAHATIPEDYEVKTIETQQGGSQTTLYRVRKKITTSYSINDNVEDQGEGQNENTEFLIRDDETVEQASTVANYVEVSNNATLTLPEGKKLEVTNGLDVTDGAVVDVKAGSTLIVGEGGVTSENTGSIVIESNENGSASFLLSPEVIVNTTPNLTVKMTVKGKGYKNESAGKTYYWHRFAAPVVMAEAWSKVPDYGTWLYGWDYSANDWAELPTSMAMVPFQGYTLSPEHLVASEDEEIVYSFKGQLAGNQNMNLQFNARGFNFFGNSYTGYIDVLTLVDQLMGNENIDGTVYMWSNGEQGYEPVSLQDLKENPSHYLDWQKEIAPMQTFILRQINTGEDVSTLLNYENSIWNNPRYGNVPAPSPAHKRAAADADPFVRVMITAANGQNSQMSFAENADRSDDFEKGYDALKYMNENSINVYSTLDGQNLANVATDNLEGKTITLQTNDEIAYTMSFLVAEGEQYAIRDNATGKVIAIEEGATYEFAAQPNSTVEGRFEIVSVAKVPTAIENAEVKANVKGIYTITGQYVGEDFEAVPAGVYVVNGVKIVK